MPNMSGRELARICHAQYPKLRVLYMSGYTNDAVGQDGLLEPGPAFIQKPFAGPVLLQRVRAVLDSASPPTV
jgi:DNA-binding response OmpR family regulator